MFMRFRILLLLLFGLYQNVSASSLAAWRKVVIDAARDEALAPNIIVRNLAILCTGAFECLNSEKNTYSSIYKFSIEKPENYDALSAIRGCLYEICYFLHPSQRNRFVRLAHLDSIATGVQAHNESYRFGQKIAAGILNIRSKDGASTNINHIGSLAPGQWRRTPPHFRPSELPNWGNVNLFCVKNKSNFIPPPPPALESQQYYNAVKEVKIYGMINSSLRTKEETMLAKFWKDFSYSSTPPGHWNEIAHFASKQKHLSLLEESRLFALLNLAMADAGILAWFAKYKYRLWRPENAIRQANQIPKTRELVFSKWRPLLESPPHPEYPSGHGSYSGAASKVLSFFFGSDSFNFSARSDTLENSVRSYSSFSSCAEEIAMSRLWGGIHFRFSNQVGLNMGNQVANYICQNFCTLLEE
jgi:membrane-associated phospholipid phosphatase